MTRDNSFEELHFLESLEIWKQNRGNLLKKPSLLVLLDAGFAHPSPLILPNFAAISTNISTADSTLLLCSTYVHIHAFICKKKHKTP